MCGCKRDQMPIDRDIAVVYDVLHVAIYQVDALKAKMSEMHDMEVDVDWLIQDLEQHIKLLAGRLKALKAANRAQQSPRGRGHQAGKYAQVMD